MKTLLNVLALTLGIALVASVPVLAQAQTPTQAPVQAQAPAPAQASAPAPVETPAKAELGSLPPYFSWIPASQTGGSLFTPPPQEQSCTFLMCRQACSYCRDLGCFSNCIDTSTCTCECLCQ